MPLSVGDKLGPYEILAAIGAGGMGEVYQARDSRVGREVAIKISAEQFSERFDREARVIASLNHPNICTLFDVGPNYLVMELVEGDAPKGLLPLDEALRIARQIADALEYAHEKGVVHRDLKPSNIKIKPDGSVKVLDFGLAKQVVAAGEGGEDSPTLSMAATRAGVILGTAAYMPPEQARGKPIDKRADIWAFGVVLYELVTGQRLFRGEDITETLASVVKEQPDLSRAPVEIRRLLQRCLEKDPRRRLRDIGDVWQLLEEAPTTSAPGAPVRPRRTAWIATIVLLTTIAGGLGYFAYRHLTEEPPRVFKYALMLPEKASFTAQSPMAVSPDGRHLAMTVSSSGQASLWVRDLDSPTARQLAGTEGATAPFWSPDSHNIAFFAGGKLKKIDLAGGPALTLCDSLFTIGGSWSKDDVILFTPALGGLFRISASGGTPSEVTAPIQGLDLLHGWPWFLPDGRHFLYTNATSDPSKSGIFLGDLDSKIGRLILTANSMAAFVAPGYLLFLRGQTLMAQPFDAASAKLTGDPVPIAQNVDQNGNSAAFSSSQNGLLAYASGGSGSNTQLTWFDRSGKPLGTAGMPGSIVWPAISPDGTAVAFAKLDPQTGIGDIWLHELARNSDSRFTFGPNFNTFPVWSADGKYVAYTGSDKGSVGIHRKATSGVAQEEVLDSGQGARRPTDWSHDYIVEEVPTSSKTGVDVWVLPLGGDKKPFAYLNAQANEGSARLSPDGQFLAYMSDESKRPEVYVQSFPKQGGKWQVSTTGGGYPVWNRNGKELYFLALDGKMMAVDVKSGATFERGVPKPLFDTHIPQDARFDVSKDGRFLIPVPVDQPGIAPLNIVINWPATLKR